jgi:hypothetical protein
MDGYEKRWNDTIGLDGAFVDELYDGDIDSPGKKHVGMKQQFSSALL